MINKIIKNNFFKLVILSAIWGSAFIAIKISVQSINPITVVTFRLTIAAFIVFTYFLYKGHNFNFSIIQYVYIFFIALIGNFLPFYLISWSEIYIASSLAGLLLTVAPIFALIFSHFLTKDDKFNFKKLFATIIGLIGAILLIGVDSFKYIFLGEIYLVLPKLAVILAAFGYVLSSIFAYNLKNINIVSLTTMVLIFSSLMSFPFMLYYEINNYSSPSINSIIAVIYLGIMPTAIAYLLRFHIIAIAGPVFLSYVAYLIPMFAIFWGVIFLKEIISLSSIMAIFIIFIGIYVGQKDTNEKKIL